MSVTREYLPGHHGPNMLGDANNVPYPFLGFGRESVFSFLVVHFLPEVKPQQGAYVDSRSREFVQRYTFDSLIVSMV